ncbi:MAG: metallophosphoesterase [Candidatus Pacearchaeota archaeon]
MVKFAHLSDIHLGGWRQQPLQELNILSFKTAIDLCIKERVDFVIISGDLFDSAFPPIDILKEAFSIFKKLSDSRIPCFLIAGSHDYSVSGKTFIDVLEKAGFCENVAKFEEIGGRIILNPTIYKGTAIYGYPGKTANLEIEDLKRAEFNDAPGLFKIFVIHTTIDKARGDLPINFIETERLPYADYYACGHLHIDFQYENFVYPGPIFPNNFQELEDLEHGRFCIIDSSKNKFGWIKKVPLKIKEVALFNVEVENASLATEKIISEMEKRDIKDKIVLLRLRGELKFGKTSDIKFDKIEDNLKKMGAYFFLKNSNELKSEEPVLDINVEETEDIEGDIIKNYSEQNESPLNKYIFQLINALSIEKQEGETTEGFIKRLTEESRKVLNF